MQVSERAEPPVGRNRFEVVGSKQYEAPERITRTSSSRPRFAEHVVRAALERLVEDVDHRLFHEGHLVPSTLAR